MFEDLFPSGRGRPSVPADVIATVMVLQSLEGLSDRDAAQALRTDIAWKVAAGLSLDDEGINYSVLTYWRTRLRQSERPERIFDAVREVVDTTGVLKGKTRRALDSTLLDDAVATQDTVTQLVSAIRRVRRLVPRSRCGGGDRPMTTTRRASRCARGTTRRQDGADHRAGQRRPGDHRRRRRCRARPASRPTRSVCWRWSPAKTSNPATATARGGSPAGGPGSGDLHGRSRGPPHAQVRQRLPRRLQGPPRGRARDRDHHRVRAHPGQHRRRADRVSVCSTARSAACRCSPTPPTAPARSASSSAADATTPRSKRSRCDARGPGRVRPRRLHHRPPAPAPRPAPPAHRVPIAAKAAPPSGHAATAARCVNAAPPASPGAPCTSANTTQCSSEPAGHGPTATSSTTTANGGRWSNAPSPGSSPDGHRRVRYRGIERNQLGLAHRVAALNLRRLVNLGLDHNGRRWTLA